ncbi:hypothetical protein [Paraburkholderia xenovorans]|uniref:hypothetical protein n=1 Tax=Paraburkholderia xenovorans TaxID=36873 RepID=UPI0038B7ABBE
MCSWTIRSALPVSFPKRHRYTPFPILSDSFALFFMARSPDHVASCISGMYMGIEVFEQYDPARAGALRDCYKYARDNDLFLT